MLIKIASPADWNWDFPSTTLVKVARDGRLRGHDRQAFIKVAHATACIFLPYLDGLKLAQDEELVHANIMGAWERWGFNRNGDGWKTAELRKSHPTFVKYAKVYRAHKNKEPALSYGVIKASAFNEAMGRVELLIGLNKTKEAAQRNNGLIADKELEQLAKEGQISWSMACRLPRDVCSVCGNEAPTRADYCKAASCPAGGCADNLTKLVKVGNDLVHLGVFNPNSVFFDASNVWKPADRTAHGSRADWLQAAAT
jgi:hypothetical protein